MRFIYTGLAVVCGALALVPSAWAADTFANLVYKENGKFRPGLAKSWSDGPAGIVLVLQPGVDAARAAQIIFESLPPGARIAREKGSLKVTGIALNDLLERLAAIAVGGDPLSELGVDELAHLDATVASAETQGGGSIRAARPTAMPVAPTEGAAVEAPTPRFEAEVLRVQRGAFPSTTLTLRWRKTAGTQAADKAQSPVPGHTADASVLFTGETAALDLQQAMNRRNLGAFYLLPGDTVRVHIVPSSRIADAAGGAERVSVDFVERLESAGPGAR